MKYLFSVGIDAVIFLCFYFALTYGNYALLNIPYFLGWFMSCVGIVAFCWASGRSDAMKDYQHKPLAWRVADVVVDIAFVILCLLCGWFVLATVYTLTAIYKTYFVQELENNLLVKGSLTKV